MVKTALGKDKVTSDLYPNQREKVKKLLPQAKFSK